MVHHIGSIVYVYTLLSLSCSSTFGRRNGQTKRLRRKEGIKGRNSKSERVCEEQQSHRRETAVNVAQNVATLLLNKLPRQPSKS